MGRYTTQMGVNGGHSARVFDPDLAAPKAVFVCAGCFVLLLAIGQDLAVLSGADLFELLVGSDNGDMAKRRPSHRRRELLILGQRLRHWRQFKGWTQEKLALAAGLDYSHYNEIENGKLNPGALTLFAIAQTLEISPALLWMPVAEAHKLHKSSGLVPDVQELRFSSQLADPDWVALHCECVALSLQAGAFEIAHNWLHVLAELHPQHWQVHYAWARYFVLRNQQPQVQVHLQVALPAQPYRVSSDSAGSDLNLAL